MTPLVALVLVQALVLTAGLDASEASRPRGTSGTVSAPANPPEPSSAPGRVRATLERGFGVESADERFSLRIGFLGQLRYVVRHTEDEDEHGFKAQIVRPTLAVELWDERVRLWFMPEFAGGSPHLLDASVRVRFHETFTLLIGQDRPRVSRGYRIGLTAQALGDRGPVVDEFRLNRDVGVTASGRVAGKFEYYFGIMNGLGPNATKLGSNPLFTARVAVAPLGRVSYTQIPYLLGPTDPRVAFGLGGYTVERERDADDGDVASNLASYREYGAVADAVVWGWRLSGLAEGFLRHRSGSDRHQHTELGVYGQLAALVMAHRLDVAVRVGALELASGARYPVESGFNVYFVGHHAKLQFRYTCFVASGPVGCNEQGAMAQLQLWL